MPIWNRNKPLMAFAALLLTAACSDDKKDGTSAMAKLAMTNSTETNLAATQSDEGMMPTVLGLKVVSVSLQPESRSCLNIPCPTIWASSLCSSPDYESEKDGKMYKYAGAPTCPEDIDIPYLDLMQSTSAVNETLNSQRRPLLPGDYAYVTITTCKETDTSSLEFQAEGMSAPARPESCNEIVSTMNPITIGEGEAVTVNLSYQISNFVMGDDYSYDPEVDSDKSTYGYEGDGVRRILLLPNDFFKLTFTKE
ncbi:MAG: hypothetical protein ACOH5I_22840 [Oligoflexus sp.]